MLQRKQLGEAQKKKAPWPPGIKHEAKKKNSPVYFELIFQKISLQLLRFYWGLVRNTSRLAARPDGRREEMRWTETAENVKGERQFTWMLPCVPPRSLFSEDEGAGEAVKVPIAIGERGRGRKKRQERTCCLWWGENLARQPSDQDHDHDHDQRFSSRRRRHVSLHLPRPFL